MTPKLEQIKHNIECLDTKRIQSVLKHLNIKWKNSSTGEKRVPTKKEIEHVAEYCMLKAFESSNKQFEIGGFEAEVIAGVVGIKFVIDKANALSKLFE